MINVIFIGQGRYSDFGSLEIGNLERIIFFRKRKENCHKIHISMSQDPHLHPHLVIPNVVVTRLMQEDVSRLELAKIQCTIYALDNRYNGEVNP